MVLMASRQFVSDGTSESAFNVQKQGNLFKFVLVVQFLYVGYG